VAQGKAWRPILVLAIDGADGPTWPETAKGCRPGRRHRCAKCARWTSQWREPKGFRFHLIEREWIEHLLSWYLIQTDDELAAALRQVQAADLVPAESVRLCIIGVDGPRMTPDLKAGVHAARRGRRDPGL
jgi:hypothetical protein